MVMPELVTGSVLRSSDPKCSNQMIEYMKMSEAEVAEMEKATEAHLDHRD